MIIIIEVDSIELINSLKLYTFMIHLRLMPFRQILYNTIDDLEYDFILTFEIFHISLPNTL